jgi:2-dehydropantoate 2-reductase
MRIAIMGSGAVGGYFGARLAAAGQDVTFIARGAHLEALRTRGLRIRSPDGDIHLPSVQATDDPANAGAIDIVLFTVKMYSTEPAAEALKPLVERGAAVVTFQNGVDSVEVLGRVLGPPQVIGGTAYVASVIAEPGVIVHTAMAKLIFGELDGTISSRVQGLYEACVNSGFQATISSHISVDIWSKFVRLSVFSGMTAVTRQPIGVLRDDPDLLAMLLDACREGIAVGTAKGIQFGPGVFDEILAMLHGLPPQAKASMLEDLERGKPLELPWLSGAVVRIGRDTGVPTPIHQFIATVLKPHVPGRAA